jgi:hypothetical protein
LLSFQVEPIFLDNENVANDLKINFHLELALTCPDTWVRHPTHLDLMYTCRNFTVFVDPTGLEPGVHSTYVKAFDVKQVLHNNKYFKLDGIDTITFLSKLVHSRPKLTLNDRL